MLFEIAVVKKPTVIEAQAGGQEELILPLSQVVASNPHAALLKVGAAQAKVFMDPKVAGTSDQWEVKMRSL